MKENQRFDSARPAPDSLSKLTADASKLGHDLVDVAGFLQNVDEKSARQLQAIVDLSSQAQDVLGANQRVRSALGELIESTGSTVTTVESSAELVRHGGAKAQDIASWVQALSDQMTAMAGSLDSVLRSNKEIAAIASQVNILAINAKIEAARAGDAGRGFAVVAEAINELSGKTADAAGSISQNVTALSEQVSRLTKDTEEVSATADAVLKESHEADEAMGQIAAAAVESARQSDRIRVEAETVREAVENFLPTFDQIGESVGDTARGVHLATEQTNGLVDLTETIVQDTVALGGRTLDQPMIDRVQADAAQIAAMFEQAVKAGSIRMEALFTRQYQEIPGSNPQQVLAPFTDLCDQVLPPILEKALDFDPHIVFCAAVDVNGYLPTHNVKFSQPQGTDPDWNMAHCRNRRIFDDRVGLKAGRSTAPFLLQVYRRDMGGGQFAMMKDLSAPIRVNGRHWGGLRLAYRFSD
ncbi:methyl-accepting chemotaxis protein [Aliiroseovarius sp.]|uniref:methyl-accepting chemotaxis protein n=1 Tax=Aliiroseovarius sp. TaxID=1872442 RepID=UPI0026346FE0|nr:methyl-accepting chemotaxis protein [Aliiroseovarius sp.]